MSNCSEEKSSKSPAILIVDGNAWLYRAHYSLPGLTNAFGFPTGAVYGTINALRKLLTKKEFEFEFCAVVFDRKGKNFRHEIYPEYKANRSPMPPELVEQLQPIREIIEAFGIKILSMENVEADDVISSLAILCQKNNVTSYIASSDKDFTQLICDKIFLLDVSNESIIDTKKVIEKFGVSPEQMVDFLSIVGDKIDNIRGVNGVGAKTAAKLLSKYPSLEDIEINIKNELQTGACSVSSKIATAILATTNQLKINRSLIALKKDLDIKYSIDDLHIGAPNKEILAQYFEKFELKSFMHLVNGITSNKNFSFNNGMANVRANSSDTAIDNRCSKLPKVDLINSRQKLQRYVDKISGRTNWIAVDICYKRELEEENKIWIAADKNMIGITIVTENIDNLCPESRSLVIGDALNLDNLHAAYIDLSCAATDSNIDESINLNFAINTIAPLLQNESIQKFVYDSKNLIKSFVHKNVTVNNLSFDCLLASFLFSNTASERDINTLCVKYLGTPLTTISNNIAASITKSEHGKYDINSILKDFSKELTSIATAVAVVIIKEKIFSEFNSDFNYNLQKIFYQIDLPLANVLAKIESTGVKIDANLLQKKEVEFAERLRTLESNLYGIAETCFNINSVQQLQTIMFDKLKLPILHKTTTGKPSTADQTLQELAATYEFPKFLLEYRFLAKLKSNYVDGLIKKINQLTGRIHTSYHQTVTSTGRLSSSNPNLQNIPARTVDGKEIRKAFVAEDGFKIISFDYSQIELRLIAHLSQDQNLIDAFATGKDIHAATASEIFGIDIANVTSEQRRCAKTINFGLMYGMSSFGLAQRLGISNDTAKKFIDTYFERYPQIQKFVKNTADKAKKNGYVETISGRILYVKDIHSRIQQIRLAAERTAINAPIQGSAADIIKTAMIDIQKWIEHNDVSARARILMQVHDELVLEIEKNIVDKTIPVIKEKMEHALLISVPLSVNHGIGDNWETATDAVHTN